jgi:hypothetical protein
MNNTVPEHAYDALTLQWPPDAVQPSVQVLTQPEEVDDNDAGDDIALGIVNDNTMAAVPQPTAPTAPTALPISSQHGPTTPRSLAPSASTPHPVQAAAAAATTTATTATTCFPTHHVAPTPTTTTTTTATTATTATTTLGANMKPAGPITASPILRNAFFAMVNSAARKLLQQRGIPLPRETKPAIEAPLTTLKADVTSLVDKVKHWKPSNQLLSTVLDKTMTHIAFTPPAHAVHSHASNKLLAAASATVVTISTDESTDGPVPMHVTPALAAEIMAANTDLTAITGANPQRVTSLTEMLQAFADDKQLLMSSALLAPVAPSSSSSSSSLSASVTPPNTLACSFDEFLAATIDDPMSQYGILTRAIATLSTLGISLTTVPVAAVHALPTSTTTTTTTTTAAATQPTAIVIDDDCDAATFF